MATIRLIHWNAGEAEERADLLRAAGWEVDAAVPRGPQLLRELREAPPDAVVVDLSRLPSGGRDMALAIRHQKATRRLPIVFLGGDPGKVACVRELLPDAVYTEWNRVSESIQSAISEPPEHPVVPDSRMAGYAGVPLTKKLGIKPGSLVGLLGAPKGFRATLGELPQDATLKPQAAPGCDLTIWFVRSRKELHAGLDRAVEQAQHGPIWIAWPKKSAKTGSDVTQALVRAAGLGSGLVDYKVCSIDETWSGLLFRRRKALS